MSLEAKIDALIVSVDALAAVMKSATTGKATVKADEKSDGKDADKPATRGRRAPAKEKVPTTSDMKKAAESFLDKSGNDEDDYNDRRAHLKKVVAKFDAPKFTEIGEDDRAAAIDMLVKFDEKDEDTGTSRKDVDDDI